MKKSYLELLKLEQCLELSRFLSQMQSLDDQLVILLDQAILQSKKGNQSYQWNLLLLHTSATRQYKMSFQCYQCYQWYVPDQKWPQFWRRVLRHTDSDVIHLPNDYIIAELEIPHRWNDGKTVFFAGIDENFKPLGRAQCNLSLRGTQ